MAVDRHRLYNDLAKSGFAANAFAASVLATLCWAGCNGTAEPPKGAPKEVPTQVEVDTGEDSDALQDPGEHTNQSSSTGGYATAEQGESQS